jgi:hypothetical protein
MSLEFAVTIIAAALIALGARLGPVRLAATYAVAAIATAVATQLGPAAHRALVALTGSDTWAGEAACWLAAYFLAAFGLSAVVFRRRRQTDRIAPSRRARMSGALLGAAAGCLLGWLACGNLADLLLRRLPAPTDANGGLVALRRPLELMRACRVLGSVDRAEAELLTSRPEVQAVLSGEPIDALLREPGMLRKVSRAADGNWLAVAALAADESVKAAMQRADFLRSVRAVDLVALAAAVEEQRTHGRTASAAGGDSVRLPALLSDAALQARLAEEWLADHEAPESSADTVAENVATADAASAERARAENARAYWENVDTILTVVDGGSRPAAWIPGLKNLLQPTYDAPAEKADGGR